MTPPSSLSRRGRGHWTVLAFGWLLMQGAACGSDDSVKCRFVNQRNLEENAATQLAAASLLPAGADLVLAGWDGAMVRWARLATTGMVGAPSTFPIPDPIVLPPQLAVTARDTAGDQLVAIYGTNGAAGIEIRAITHVAGEAPAAPVTIAIVPPGISGMNVQLAVGSSRTGKRAVIAWGVVDPAATNLQILVLGPNATPVGLPLAVASPAPSRCLQFVSSRSDFALAFLTVPAGANASAVIQEGTDVGGALERSTLELNTKTPSCPVMAASDRGYVLAFQTPTGTWVTDYDTKSGTVSPQFVASAITFGSGPTQPPVAGVASMGFNTAVLFGVDRGPEVWLFEPLGARVGKELKLPATTRDVGAVATLSVGAALYATYREQSPTNPTQGPRWYMKVECPSP